MILSCPICQEIFLPTCEIVANKCGHLFHAACLKKWFDSCGKRAKTCPQCRAPAFDSDVIKIFFNISEGLGRQEDAATLAFKLEGSNYQLSVKEREIHVVRDALEKEKEINRGLRKMIVEIEQKEQNQQSLISILKYRISEFSTQTAAFEKLKAENQRLKDELSMLNELRTFVTSTAQEVDEMLENFQNKKSLAVMVSTAKKEMVNQKSKKIRLEKQVKILQNEAKNHEKQLQFKDNKLLEIEVKYEAAQRKIASLENLLVNCKDKSPKTPNKSVHASIIEATPESVQLSSNDTPRKHKRKLKIVNQSDSLNEELERARSSKSPYLPLKSYSLSSLVEKRFKKSKLADIMENYKPLPDEAFNGMGGSPAVEEFPKVNFAKKKKLKRLAPLINRPTTSKPNASILDVLHNMST